MANEWQSLLPSAWKPQDPNTQVQAAKAGAETALTNAQTATQAVDAVARNQERIRKQALQDVIAKSVRTTMGPDGKLIKVIDQDRFFEAMSKSPAAADAYDKFVAVAYPQMQREAVQRGLSAAVTPEGGVDQAKVAAAAQRSPFGASIVSEAAAQQKQRLGEAAAQAGDLTTIGALTTSPEGAARPGTLVGNAQMQPRSFGTSGIGTESVKPEQIDKLSPATRRAAVLNLRAAGFTVSDDATSSDIANAATSAFNAKIQSGMAVKSLGDLPASVFNVALTAPYVRQEVLGKIFGGELDVRGKEIANKRADLETEAVAQQAETIDKIAKRIGVPADMVGSNLSPETNTNIRAADDAVYALGELKENIREIVHEIDVGKYDPNTPDGNKQLSAELVAQLGVLQRIYGGGGTEGGVERALQDIGAPSDLTDAIKRGGVDAAKTWVSNKTVNWRQLLSDAPKRAALSAVGLLRQAKSANPQRVLINAGHGDLLPKRLPGSAFGPKDGKYKATKINAVGMRMGQKADGTWEPIR